MAARFNNWDYLNQAKPGHATTHISARSSPRLSVSDEDEEGLVDQISCSQEEQEYSGEDSGSEGGVFLT